MTMSSALTSSKTDTGQGQPHDTHGRTGGPGPCLPCMRHSGRGWQRQWQSWLPAPLGLATWQVAPQQLLSRTRRPQPSALSNSPLCGFEVPVTSWEGRESPVSSEKTPATRLLWIKSFEILRWNQYWANLTNKEKHVPATVGTDADDLSVRLPLGSQLRPGVPDKCRSPQNHSALDLGLFNSSGKSSLFKLWLLYRQLTSPGFSFSFLLD